MNIDNSGLSKSWNDGRYEDDPYFYILAPLDVSLTLLVKRSGKIENDAPQYSVSVELSGLIVSLDEAQLQQILTMWDYLCTCPLREKYGRYRPWSIPPSRKFSGWQTMWWHYAQQSVLSDVRKRLKKTSWKYLGERINFRRKYVKLYKNKLERLQQEQLVDDDIIRELEQMEKESDVDDILSYRSAAELELQESFINSASNIQVVGVNTVEKPQNDELSSSRSRGWLNWLSLGMLGAGGTDESSQFSGVVSDEVIQDIYEATKFHPLPSSNGDASADNEIYLSAVKFTVNEISATLRNVKLGQAIAALILKGIFIECKLWDESAVVTASVNAVKMINPCNEQVNILTGRAFFEEDEAGNEHPSLSIQVDISCLNQDIQFSPKVILQPLEVTYDSKLLLNIVELYNLVDSFKFQHERVIMSLNGIEDIKTRLMSKNEFIMSSRKRVNWDVNFNNIIISIPWEDTNAELHHMTLECGALSFVSKFEVGKNFVGYNTANHICKEFQLQDIYDHFEIKINDFEMKIKKHLSPLAISVLNQLCASISLATCIIPDEPILQPLEVYIFVSSLHANFSPSINTAIQELIANFDVLHSKLNSVTVPAVVSHNITPSRPKTPKHLCFSVTMKLGSFSLQVDLENEKENSCTLMFALQQLDFGYALTEFLDCWISVKAMSISMNSRGNSHILCSSTNLLASQHDVTLSSEGNSAGKTASVDECFIVHYEAYKRLELSSHKCDVHVNDLDFHCYPQIIGLLIEFFDKISGSGTRSVDNSCSLSLDKNEPIPARCFGLQQFGFSNFSGIGLSEYASIPLDRFPFLTICSDGSLGCLENLLIHAIPDWRKFFHLRESKASSPTLTVNKRSKISCAPPVKSTFSEDQLPCSQSFGFFDLHGNLNVSGIRVYFHDSSCILGTMTLPACKCIFSINKDCFDILCSTEGLLLSSSWWAEQINEFLWGPSLPNLSPILNIRVKKFYGELSRPEFEICFSIQHVCCFLPADFLAVMIGYFSLPGWTSTANEYPVTENKGYMASNNSCCITYKFEILDSLLFTPVECDGQQFLKLKMPQLYCNFLQNCDAGEVLKDIPPECLVPTDNIADNNECFNIFGRDISLSLLLKEGTFDVLAAHNSGHRNIIIIEPLNADIWVRIPCESESQGSTVPYGCIMARIRDCHVNAEDGYIFIACQALLDVVNEFDSAYEKSKGFTSDLLNFRQIKRCVKENIALPSDASTVTFTEVRCCVNSLTINLCHSRIDQLSLEPVAKAEIQLICTSLMRNEIPQLIDLSFSSLELFSLHNSVMLVQCPTSCSASSVLDLHLSMSDQGVNELISVFLPSIDIWLYLFDWIMVIDLFNSYYKQWDKTSVVNACPKVLTLGRDLTDQCGTVTADVSPDVKQDDVSLTVKLQSISATLHIPVSVYEEAFSAFAGSGVQEERPSNNVCNKFKGECCGFIAVILQSRYTELIINGKTASLKSNMEKVDGTVRICKSNAMHSWPLFQLFQVNLVAEIINNPMELLHIQAEVQCDSVDVWLSHQIFYFWRHIWFEFPESESSELMSCHFNLKMHLMKGSLLLTDARCGASVPLLEILVRNLLFQSKMMENKMESSLTGDLQVNYNNIHKVLWEPFVEPWKFQMTISRIQERSALLNSDIMTNIHLLSTAELNLNITESLIEAVFRAIEMIKDAWSLRGLKRAESQKFLNSQISESVSTRRYAPYILQNLTSLPLVFHVYRGQVDGDDCNALAIGEEIFVEPGAVIPIYINETPNEQLFRYRPDYSSQTLNHKQFDGVSHHYVVIQLDGTSAPSDRISVDLVGLSYFEVDLTDSSNKIDVDIHGDASNRYKNIEEKNNEYGGFVVPVVFDVSVQHYSKLVQLYSTVVLINATSMPFELRFDIPFGVSPKILDPIYPGQEFPLPLHLAEGGSMRWRPLGNTYLWSEVHNISNILAHANGISLLRSFVCYPSHPSSDPFRCCISVQDVCLPSTDRSKNVSSLRFDGIQNRSFEGSEKAIHKTDKSKKRFIHKVTLRSPLVVKSYLPEALSLTIESGGVSRTAFLSEVETSFFHIDSSHDLGITFHMEGYRPSVINFQRAETFNTIAKSIGTKFSLSETITFNPALTNGPICVNVEKVLDAFSGAREIYLFVPLLLYNCTGFSLTVSNSANETKGHCCVVPSCYDLGEQDLLLNRKEGLGLLFSNENLNIASLQKGALGNASSKIRIVSARNSVDPQSGKFLAKPSMLPSLPNEHSDNCDFNASKASLKSLKSQLSSSSQSIVDHTQFEGFSSENIKGFAYSPTPESSANDFIVRVSCWLPAYAMENMPKCSWSSPFALVSPSGSTSVLVPQPFSNAAYIISVTSSAVAGTLSGRTSIVTFQPRYIISNASSKDLCFKQKGTDSVFKLGVGQHRYLHWMDTRRELLVSIRFVDPGWQWSGSFRPDHLGDTQVKMRDYISGAINIIRVEVQNADVSIEDVNILGSSHANSGTTLILLSDDDTGYMPYRIDNFSKERLRVYQRKCETSETIIHSYTSCPYAWDEPCYPHRLTVEVPGERIIGSYPLDDVKNYAPVSLPSTSEKPERTLLISVHAEGATKVLIIVDSSYHVLNDEKEAVYTWYKGKRIHDEKQETFVDYKETISVAIPFIGISLMNSYPQEMLFASAKNTLIDLFQSVDQQKFSFQMSSLQIDNQLPGTLYPVIMSFDHEQRSHAVSQIGHKDDNISIKTDSSRQIAFDGLSAPLFCLAAAKWRNKDISLISFQYINLRVADFHLELEQEVILSVLDFFRNIFSRFQGEAFPYRDSIPRSLTTDLSFEKESSMQAKSSVEVNGDLFHSTNVPLFTKSSHLLPSVVPIGAPWQQIYLLARRQKKIYVEVLDVAPIKLTLSFSSSPWILRSGVITSGESLIHKALTALGDIEGAQIYLKKLTIAHHMASWESVQQILMRHYTRQILHEMYKVFGSAGVIGNPMGFARSVGLGIKDFLSVPARSFLQSPAGLIAGMAQGTTSLLSNTVYAVSDAATQFSRAAHKGIVAFTLDDQAVAKMEMQQKGNSSDSKGVIDEIFEGLTGLLQSPIKGAEKHGLPGVLSGIAIGITGVVARPAASILKVTGKTAQSIRNRSRLHQMERRRLRVRLPRPLSKVLPLRPYSWEVAAGTSILKESSDFDGDGDGDGLRLKDEVLIMCKELERGGQFVVITGRVLLVVSCDSLVGLGKPGFEGVPPDPKWVIEAEIGMDSIIHADTSSGSSSSGQGGGGVVHIVGSSSDTIHHLKRINKQQWRRNNNNSSNPPPLPLFQTNLEFKCKQEADNFLQVLLSTVEKAKEQGLGFLYLLHRSNLK